MRRPSALSLVVGAVLVLIAVVIARNTEWGEIAIPTPLRGEAAANPFYAAQRLVELLGATSERRESLGETSTAAIVVLSSFSWDLNDARREALERWVERGGRLVVDASLITGGDVFEQWSGVLRQREEPAPADEELFEPPEEVEDCRTLLAVGADGRDSFYEGCGFDQTSWLVTRGDLLWSASIDEQAHAVRTRVGEGAVTVVNAVPFIYRALLEGDHGALFVAASDLRVGDHVVFVSEADVASLPELIWRHGTPVVLVLALFIALALWRGAVRFGPLLAPPERARRSLAEQIRGTGRFALRVGGGAALVEAARRALHEAAARRIVGYERLAAAERSAVVARLAGVDSAELAAALDSHSARPLELRSKLALLETARRQLISGSQWSKHATGI